MAVKRRIIWMTDSEWKHLKKIAADRGETVSGVIRGMWDVASRPQHFVTPEQAETIVASHSFGSPRPAPKTKSGK